EQILPNASVIAQGHGDEGHVHQLRVGIRRLRTALRELDAFAPGRFDPDWQAPLRTAFRRLGELRDGEHVLESFDEALRASGGPAIAAHEPPSTSAQEVVGDGAFQAALIALMGFAAAGASAPAKPLPTGTHPPALDA
uniref:CHAD domain-containing protein n=1 Tax=Raoultella sp. 18073 TaxID=2681452 RepID=UPI001358FE20